MKTYTYNRIGNFTQKEYGLLKGFADNNRFVCLINDRLSITWDPENNNDRAAAGIVLAGLVKIFERLGFYGLDNRFDSAKITVQHN